VRKDSRRREQSWSVGIINTNCHVSQKGKGDNDDPLQFWESLMKAMEHTTLPSIPPYWIHTAQTPLNVSSIQVYDQWTRILSSHSNCIGKNLLNDYAWQNSYGSLFLCWSALILLSG
jgi:hypothetical protein